MKKAKKVIAFYFIYTILFLMMLWGVFHYFPENDKILINHADAFRQHLRAVAYYSKWLRGVIYNVFVLHDFSLQTFSFGMGYGSDLYTTLQYYAIGDILNLPSVFVKTEYIYIYFQVITLLRPYLAGIAFSLFVRYIRPEVNLISLISGMLIYSFGSFYLFLGIWHPFFANPLIYFPLLLLGAERLIREKKSAFFTVSVFFAATNNFYFFYTMTVLLVIYAVVRLLQENGRNLKETGLCIVSFLVHGTIGVLMSMFILLPVIFALPNNPRSNSGISVPFLYAGDYYRELIKNMISFVYHGQFDLQLGFTGIFIVALALLLAECITSIILKKKEVFRKEIALFFILALFVVVPFSGYLLAGFSYVINRWCFACALLAGFLVTELSERIVKIERLSFVLTLVTSVIFMAGVFAVYKSSDENLTSEMCIAAASIVALTVVRIAGSKLQKSADDSAGRVVCSIASIIVFAATASGILLNADYAYSSEKGNMIADYMDKCTPEEMHLLLESTETQVVEEAAAQDGLMPYSDFYRYSGRNLIWNASLMDGISSTQFLWSLTDTNVSDFFMAMANNDEQNFAYLGLDNRAILNAMNGVNYFSLRYNTPEEGALVPAGYAEVYGKYNFVVFENINALPLGYGSGNIISRDEFYELTPIQRQEALLYGTVVDDGDIDQVLAEAEPVLTSEKREFEIADLNGVELRDGGLHSEAGGSMTLSFDGMEGSETYLYFKGLNVTTGEEVSTITVSTVLSDGTCVTNALNYKSESSQYYSGWHDFLINLGAGAEAKNNITVTFGPAGEYNFEELSVYCQPVENIAERLSLYREDALQNPDLHKNPISYASNRITGDFNAKGDELLVVNLPYSKGFHAFVDGKKSDIIKANIMFMAIPVTEGQHEIVLEYHTPGLMAGILISLIGLILFIFTETSLFQRITRR